MAPTSPSIDVSQWSKTILDAAQATGLLDTKVVQSLWGGYGQILRCQLSGGPHESVVVKHVKWPTTQNHPRGWNSSNSHERKVRSYEVETNWYAKHALSCDDACRVPQCLAQESRGNEVLIVLEDLDEAGFGARRSHVTDVELSACLSWLAHFHAKFMGKRPAGLWDIGTYWHLATRPDELEVLSDMALKQAASAIDLRLNSAAFQTFVHGDAKLANFCFSPSGTDVAAVDFQYVGGGCGMKDVAYFLSSCLDETQCEQRETELLERYFGYLEMALRQTGEALDFKALEHEWRALYPVAWTDFFRFLKGWSPGHWKIHSYSERLAREVLAIL